MQVGERAQERRKIYKRAKEDKMTLIRMAKFNCSCFAAFMSIGLLIFLYVLRV